MSYTRRGGLALSEASWAMQRALITQLEAVWDDPDEGIWEARWTASLHALQGDGVAALDRVISSAEEFRLSGPLPRWRALRDDIHAAVCPKGYDADAGVFRSHSRLREPVDMPLTSAIAAVPALRAARAHSMIVPPYQTATNGRESSVQCSA